MKQILGSLSIFRLLISTPVFTARRHVLLGILSFTVTLIISSVVHAGGLFFDSDSVQIHYYDQGKGVPVVLLHGGAGSASFWREDGGPDYIGYDLQGALVAAGYRVLAVNLRGYGKSDKPHHASAYGFEMAYDIVRLLDYLRIEKAHIVGYAQGGLIANWVRRKFPDRLLSVTMCSGGLLPEDSFWVVHADAFADAMAKSDMMPVVREMTPPGQPMPSREAVQARYADMYAKIDMLALAAMVRAQGIPDSRKELADNKVPSLAVIGELDHNRRDVEVMAKDMSNLKMIVLSGASHQAAVRTPRFLAELLKFMHKNQ